MGRNERVTGVIDGDTFRTNMRKKSVRLAGVNSPEKGQPGFAAAKRNLQGLIKGKTVNIETVTRDKYGRAVAKVKVGRRSINNAMRTKIKK